MSWHTTPYRLPPEAKPGKCQRPISDKFKVECPAMATCGFTSIHTESGDYRYTERCDFCTIALADRMGLKPPGLREALIFHIHPADRSGRCSSCNALVRWVTTAAGRPMPADPNGISHFLSCPNSNIHRKRA